LVDGLGATGRGGGNGTMRENPDSCRVAWEGGCKGGQGQITQKKLLKGWDEAGLGGGGGREKRRVGPPCISMTEF